MCTFKGKGTKGLSIFFIWSCPRTQSCNQALIGARLIEAEQALKSFGGAESSEHNDRHSALTCNHLVSNASPDQAPAKPLFYRYLIKHLQEALLELVGHIFLPALLYYRTLSSKVCFQRRSTPMHAYLTL